VFGLDGCSFYFLLVFEEHHRQAETFLD
jgi:hypothetical protein